ncbi:MAG: hypothetical protein H0X24_17305, partial [Ktedonobacterales bacterium]|nr:hypothetical protein [Ktedonobacterales bacterium]
MYLEALHLTDYRNYADEHLVFGPGRFIVAGDNAQGKSNLCEAIRMLATMRSFRAGTDRELVRWGASGHFARLAAAVERAGGPLKLEIVISAPPSPDDPDGLWANDPTVAAPSTAPSLPPPPLPPGMARATGKRIRIDGAARRAIDCVGLVTVVLFEPADLDLVIGGPAGRRHFMDVTLCQ